MANTNTPTTDAGLLAHTQNIVARLGSSPELYGETGATVDAYGNVQTAFALKLETATAPPTRTKVTVAEKQLAAAELRRATAQLAKRVAGFPGITDALLIGLGLAPRRRPTPVPVPAGAPDIDLVAVVGNTVMLRLHDAASAGRRGLPSQIAGATIFSHVGPTPPGGSGGSGGSWAYRGGTTRAACEVAFDADLPMGTTVWVTCNWRNAKDQSGPAARPVSATLLGTGALPAGSASQRPAMKIAA